MKKEKLISIAYCILCFAVLWALHAGPFPLVKDTYGLCAGKGTIEYATDFFSLISLLYVNSVKYMFWFFGEKASVVAGFHVACCFLSFLLVYMALKRFYKQWLTYVGSALFLVLPLLMAQILNYDGWVVMEFFVCLLFYLVICLFFVILKLNYGPEVSLMRETLSERERRQSQEPKTIVNDKGETITLLANPLPGPKKHVKRTLDFDFDVPENQMFYDKEGFDYDDYDIR